MAETKGTAPAPFFADVASDASAIDLHDAITRRLGQATAVARLMALTVDHWDEVPDVTLPNAAWAVQDLLDQVRLLADEQCDRAKFAERPQGAFPSPDAVQ